MNFLLIDFGASHQKSIVYNKETNSFSNSKVSASPLANADKLSKDQVLQTIQTTLRQYQSIDAVVMCSVLGGYYVNDIYYSWKCADKPSKPKEDSCLLSELFKDQKTYHIHAHHSKNSTVEGLKILGRMDDILFYSALGDTNCVIASVTLLRNELLINLGTGSQIIGQNHEGKHELTSFIPSGRALNSFKLFFDSFDINLFDEFAKLTVSDLEKSTMTFDLNVFPQAYRYMDGGSIRGIQEANFNKANFISSLFRSYLEQYLELINLRKAAKIFLAGGISKRYPLIANFLSYKSGLHVVTTSFIHEDTHIGMGNLIKQFL